MKRSFLASLLLIALPAAAAAQQPAPRPVSTAPTTAAAKIANAVQAAPASLSAQATILDWPATPDGKLTVLRQGSNGWSCLPDHPQTEGNDPMCLDEPWLRFIEAYLTQKQPPAIDRVGVGYMLAPGGGHGSASDPYADKPTAMNHWGHDGPHVMLLVPDVRTLQALPTTRDGSRPYVMWAGTPYAHIMVPTTDAAMPKK